MNLIYQVVFTTQCRSTHHKLAMDSLRMLQGPDAFRWQRLFLWYHGDYLRGAKAPDKKFKDFRNHVLHVGDNCWGGAAKSAKKWYEETVGHLRRGAWSDAIYAAGVLSHYYTDAIQPFHTDQSTEEGNIHRAVEWSITKSYLDLQRLGSVPRVEIPDGPDWLETMVIDGATRAHQHYQELIDHYDYRRGLSDPPAGLDDHSRRFIADLLAYATVGFSRILERATLEASIDPPLCLLTLPMLLATIQVPVRVLVNKILDSCDDTTVHAMYKELLQTGSVNFTLSEDDRVIRRLKNRRRQEQAYTTTKAASTSSQRSTREPQPRSTREHSRPAEYARPVENSSQDEYPLSEESLRSEDYPRLESYPEPPRQTGELSETSGSQFQRSTRRSPSESNTERTERTERRDTPRDTLRFRLELNSDVVDAPSIGTKTARRLNKVGIRRVSDLLTADPQQTARRLNVHHIRDDTIRDWQDQASLVCRIPEIYGHDAQILVACGYRKPSSVARADPEDLLLEVLEYTDSDEGGRILRSSKKPDEQEIANWIRWASQARSLRAA